MDRADAGGARRPVTRATSPDGFGGHIRASPSVIPLKEEYMKYVLMVYQGPTPTLPGSDRWKALPEGEQKAIYTDYSQINKMAEVAPGLPLGLPDAARTVQVKDGKPQIKNGTYLPEGVGGYMVLEAENMEAAIALATRIPAARLGGAVEIRPAEQYW